MRKTIKSISLNIDFEKLELKGITKLSVENRYIILRGTTTKGKDIVYKREFTDTELTLNHKII